MHRTQRTISTVLTSLLLATSAAAPFALAQPESAPTQPAQPGRQGPGARPPSANPLNPAGMQGVTDPGYTGPAINITFAGGTLAAYVQAVRDAATKAGQPVNIVLPKEAEDEPVPAISLVNVTPRTALDALSYAFPEQAGPQVATKTIGSPGEQSLTFALRYVNTRYTTRNAGGPVAFNQFPRSSRVYSLRSLIESPEGLPPDPALTMPVENVLSALKAAAELESSANAPESKTEPPEFLLHKESQLLICRGTDSQQRLVESLLGELQATIVPRRARATEAAKESAAMKMQEIALEARIEQETNALKRSENELGLARAKLDRTTMQHEAGQVNASELDLAKREFSTAQSNLEGAKSCLRSAQSQMEVLRAQISGRKTIGLAPPVLGGVEFAGPTVKLTYEVKDLEPLHKDLYAFCKLAVPGDWDNQGPYDQEEAYRHAPKDPNRQKYNSRHWVLEMWKRSGQMPMVATREQHRTIAQYLTTVRRAKANEPDLPGLDIDQMIQKGEAK